LITGELPEELLSMLTQSHAELSGDSRLGLHKGTDGLYRTVAGQVYLPTEEVQAAVVGWMHNKFIHPGSAKTLARVRRYFWFKGMKEFVLKYTRACPTCQSAKISRIKKSGPMHPLFLKGSDSDITSTFQALAVDFVWGMPSVRGMTGIMTLVDLFSKMTAFIPVKAKVTGQEVADLIHKHWIAYYGVPSQLHSDNDVRFMSEMWNLVLRNLGIGSRRSSVYHPQSNGTVERMNATLVDALTAHRLDTGITDWVSVLPWLSFCLNSVPSEGTQVSPHQLVFGRNLPDLPALDVTNELGLTNVVPHLSAQERAALRELATQSLHKQALKMIERDGSAQKIINVGDLVMLSTSKLRLARGAGQKVVPRWIGPFKVKGKPHPNAVALELPESYKFSSTWNLEYVKSFVTPDVPVLPDHVHHGFALEDLVGDDVELPLDEAVESTRMPVELYFDRAVRGVRHFRVRFENESWDTCEVLSEPNVVLMPNGKALLTAWLDSISRTRRRG